MKLVVLCVDGLDPDYARELGFPKMPYESRLKIPDELYYDGVLHTQLIWPSILSGRVVITELKTSLRPNIWLSWIRLPIRRFLHKYGIKWKRKKRMCRINPSNVNIKTVADKYNSIMWNFPTICPEFVSGFPTPNERSAYERQEYKIWKIIADGMCLYPYDLSVAYCRLPDILGHLKKSPGDIYHDIHHHAMTMIFHRLLMRLCARIYDTHKYHYIKER